MPKKFKCLTNSLQKPLVKLFYTQQAYFICTSVGQVSYNFILKTTGYLFVTRIH